MPPRKRGDYESESASDEPQTSTKKSKKTHTKPAEEPVVGGGARNENGEEYWELSGTRRLLISEFKGKRMISIREFYEKDGKHLPGKKGITLPAEQFAKVVELLPHVEAVLKEKGETLARPQYDTEPMEEVKDEEEEEQKSKVKREPKKRNIEETSSDED